MLMTLAVLCFLVALVFGLALSPAYFWWFLLAGVVLTMLHLLPPRKLPPMTHRGVSR